MPTWWQALLLTGGSFRIWRLLAADVILDKPRDWLTRRDSYEVHRENLDVWLHCPWCCGFWIGLLVYGSWLAWPQGTLIVCTPLTVNAAMALVAKHWDA